MRALSALVLILALALTACGDGDDSSDSSHSSTKAASRTTGESSSVSSTEPAQDTGSDQAIADASVLTIDDMPDGWQGAPDDDDEDDSDAFAECLGIDVTEFADDANPSADSEEFKSPEGVTVSNSVEVSPDEDWMTHAFEVQSSDEFRSCAVEVLEQSIAKDDEDLEWGEVKVLPMDFPTYGDEVTAFRVAVPVTTQNETAVVVSDNVLARVGRADVTVSATSASGPMPVTELAGYLQTSVERLQGQLGDS